MIQVIEPKDKAHWLELRKQDVTSTEVSALFGVSPYLTGFELWHSKKNQTESSFAENTRMVWGTRLQDAIAQGVAKDNGWQIRAMTEYVRDTDLRMGSSFDYQISPDGLLEIKNVDALQFQKKWIKAEDVLEAPLHIEMQVQHQLAVSGAKFAYLSALVGGNTVELVRREPDEAVIKAMRLKVEQFWKSIRDNTPPKPDFERDAEFVKSLYPDSMAGKTLNVTDPEFDARAKKYADLGEQIKELETARSAAQARMIVTISNSERVLGNGYTISYKKTDDKQVPEKIVPAHVQPGRRTFRLTMKGE